MAKRQSKSQKLNDLYVAFKAARENTAPKREGAKDGSIATHSVVDVLPYSEAIVLKQCTAWLKTRGILCDRNNVGSGDLRGTGGYFSYGIKNAGDIIGLLPSGKHFEIECKRGQGGRLSEGQQKRMFNITASNGVYLIIHGVEELEYYMGGVI